MALRKKLREQNIFCILKGITLSLLVETAMKKFSSYKNEKAVPDNQILNAFSEENVNRLI
jgi:hypothetical protein